MNPQVQDLLERSAAGDFVATNFLFRMHQPMLNRYVACRACHRLRGRLDSDDVSQETLVRAMRQLPTYLTERRIPFGAWLRCLADEVIIELYRKHKLAQCRSITREEQVHDCAPREAVMEKLVCRGHSPSSAVSATEQTCLLRVALSRLYSEDREVIRLRFFEGLSSDEAATRLGISAAAVRMRQMRVLKHVRELFSSPTGDRA